MEQKKIAIIGAGPSGMACAYTLVESGKKSTVFESESAVGGLCRTIDFGGYLFDIGGHRFLSKSPEINKLWLEVMSNDMLRVKRMSKIYYKKRYFRYPLSFFNAFWSLGPMESFLSILSFFWCKAFKPANDNTFEGWIINRFGKRLFNIFFKIYTEKVWAVPCRDISADWAEQRIRGLSLKIAIKKAIFKVKRKAPKTLCEEFLYPKHGPGEFYKRLEEVISKSGSEFKLNSRVVKIKHDGKKVLSIGIKNTAVDKKEELSLEYLFSSMPLPELIGILEPKPPDTVLSAAKNLHFRNFLVVNVILNREHIFPDQWIYVHSPEVKMGRIQNYKNWSGFMARDAKKTALGLEYFCSEGDRLWMENDIDLINYAVNELEKIGISSRKYLINGFVVRCKDVYPVYSLDYQNQVSIVKEYLSHFPNLQTIGRCGLFRYDNSDHALLTGIYAARNFLGNDFCDVWNINADDTYLEE